MTFVVFVRTDWKQIWNKDDYEGSKNKVQTRQLLKRTLTWQYKTCANFGGKPLYQSQKTTVKRWKIKTLLSGCDCGLLNAWSVLSVKYNIFNYQPFNCCFAALKKGLTTQICIFSVLSYQISFLASGSRVWTEWKFCSGISFRHTPCSRDTKVKGLLSSNHSSCLQTNHGRKMRLVGSLFKV